MAAYASSPTSLTASMEQNGPRAKCDQVIFEAIAKAAEIIVNGRTRPGYNQHDIVSGGMAFGASRMRNTTSSVGSSSSRFNLMVPELANIRYVRNKNLENVKSEIQSGIYIFWQSKISFYYQFAF
jgi:hypothetical protein